MSHTYESNFTDCYIDIKPLIDKWPNTIDPNGIIKFVNYTNANMIFIPVFTKDEKQIISKSDFYCSVCKRWYKICSSVKQIKQHASIHIPDLFKKSTNAFNEEQEKVLFKNITAFILFETNSFISIESPFIQKISEHIPNKNKLLIALKNIADYTRNQIKALVSMSSANYITFDQWSDKKTENFYA